VIWSRLAEEDLTGAYLFIGGDSPAAAERLLDAVEGAVQFLLENPEAGRLRLFQSPLAGGVRSWAVKSFPAWLVLYRTTGEDLEIVRFLHGARDFPRLLED